MGRNSKPIGLHLAEGNPNRLTKEQIKQRQEAEIKLGKSELDKLKPPPFIKNDVNAYSCWKHYMKEYKEAAKQGIDLLTTSDVGLLAMYCKTYSEYENLLNQYQKLERIAINQDVFKEYMEGILKIDTAINKKMDMLLKMQDRLFLNPLAKVKNVPKPKEKEKPPSKFGKFGGGRGV
ncbi:P27 family phage terminase small subunit [Paenibacillus popilliae]|uniref:Phage terminase n=1 Tax=Paenibacillus popilliae ATCC 14706 TaxID=1212764 RepID=M9M189_PAEPP|nr:P27 family phage terminase small subunit [Paenibacillus popilliae]GAC40848.1 phage terminase [Paenibacillus popilliae ATCC 14706]